MKNFKDTDLARSGESSENEADTNTAPLSLADLKRYIQELREQLHALEIITDSSPDPHKFASDISADVREAGMSIRSAFRQAFGNLVLDDNAFQTVINVALRRSVVSQTPLSTPDIAIARNARKRPLSRLARFVKKIRVEAGGITQQELQEKMKFPKPQYISKIEQGGVGKPSKEFLEALSLFTGLSIEELIAMNEDFSA